MKTTALFLHFGCILPVKWTVPVCGLAVSCLLFWRADCGVLFLPATPPNLDCSYATGSSYTPVLWAKPFHSMFKSHGFQAVGCMSRERRHLHLVIFLEEKAKEANIKQAWKQKVHRLWGRMCSRIESQCHTDTCTSRHHKHRGAAKKNTAVRKLSFTARGIMSPTNTIVTH